jgi:hypothetical protein
MAVHERSCDIPGSYVRASGQGAAVGTTRRPERTDNSVKTYLVTCQGVFDQAVIARLGVLGVYWTQGGSPDTLLSNWNHHHMLIDAINEDQAIQKARLAIETSGGFGTGYTCLSELSETA